MLLIFALLFFAQPGAGHSTLRFRDARYSVSFLYPRGYTLKKGPLGPHDSGLGTLGPIPMEFAAPGGVRIATVEAPSSSYRGTDFKNAFFTVSVNRLMKRSQCRQFSGSEGKSPAFLLKTRSGTVLRGVLQSDGGMGHQFVGAYFHAYSNGQCVEFGYGMATAGLGAVDGMRPAPYRTIQAHLKAILLSAEISKAADDHDGAGKR